MLAACPALSEISKCAKGHKYPIGPHAHHMYAVLHHTICSVIHLQCIVNDRVMLHGMGQPEEPIMYPRPHHMLLVM